MLPVLWKNVYFFNSQLFPNSIIKRMVEHGSLHSSQVDIIQYEVSFLLFTFFIYF